MIRDWILKHAPDFCWLTCADLLRMCETDFPNSDICPFSFQVIFSKLYNAGHFIKKEDPAYYPSLPGHRAALYLRVEVEK